MKWRLGIAGVTFLLSSAALGLWLAQAVQNRHAERARRKSGGLFDLFLGGAHSESVCFARRADRWELVGLAWKLDDCQFGANDTATPSQQVSSRRRANALASLNAVRAAVRDAPPHLPRVCEGLHKSLPRDAPLFDLDQLGGALSEEQLRASTSFSSDVLAGCLGHEPVTVPGHRACELQEPLRYVLAYANEVNEPPVQTGDSFVGGHWKARLIVIDVPKATALCAQ